MENDFLSYLDMMANGPTITLMSIITEIICFVLICGISIFTLFIAYKLKPVLSKHKKHFIISGIALILLFNLIYPRLPYNPYFYYVPFLVYLRPIIIVAVLSVIEYFILSSKKTSKNQLIKSLTLQGILILSVYGIITWISSIIISIIISSIL